MLGQNNNYSSMSAELVTRRKTQYSSKYTHLSMLRSRNKPAVVEHYIRAMIACNNEEALWEYSVVIHSK